MTKLRQALASCVLAAAAALLPPSRRPLADWADEHMRLSSESSVQAGAWSTFTYQVEALNTLGDTEHETVVLKWASQMGKTSMMLAMLANVITCDPGPALCVTPNLTMAEAFSKERLSPMFRDVRALKGLVSDPKSRDAGSTIFHRRFTGGHVSVVGSNSPAGLASRPVRYLWLDEVDRFEASAGSEGDPVDLATARTRTFWNRKLVLASSPTIKDASRIDTAWLESDQRVFEVPCPLCGMMQVLHWKRVEWPEGRTEEAVYRCAGCEQTIPHHRKAAMLAKGRWRAQNPGAKSAGFWISELYSPWRAWGELAHDWLKAQGNIERLRAFINTSLAELWDDQAQANIDVKTLLARCESWGSTLPDGVAVLTAGVDVQADRVELELVGWGRGEESWSLDYRVFPGDPEGAGVWATLDEYLRRTWPHRFAGGLPVSAACIDSGAFTQAVYRFCGTRYGRRIFAIKGKAGALPVWPKKPTRKSGTLLYTVGVDSAKATLYGRLKIQEAGPGYAHFPADRREQYFEQLLSEHLVTSYRRGRPVREWRRKKGQRAEALDARNYAFAALQALISMGMGLDAECDRIESMRAGVRQEVYRMYKSKFMSGG